MFAESFEKAAPNSPERESLAARFREEAEYIRAHATEYRDWLDSVWRTWPRWSKSVEPRGRAGVLKKDAADATIAVQSLDAEWLRDDHEWLTIGRGIGDPVPERRRLGRQLSKLSRRILKRLDVVRQFPADAPAGRTVAANTADDQAMFTVARLALIWKVPQEALRKRLERFRKKNPAVGDGWIEDSFAASRDGRFLYEWGRVRHIVEALGASGEASVKRPARRLLNGKSR